MSALSNVIRSRATSSASNALPGLKGWAIIGAARAGEGEVDVAGRPAESERRRAHADPDRAVRAVRAAVRVGARDEMPGEHESLLRKVKMENPVAGRRVVRLVERIALGERAP